MNKRLIRLIRPGMGVYFAVMLCFCLAALVLNHLVLAAMEAVITLVLFSSYMIMRKIRHRNLQRYIESMPNTAETKGSGESPFPSVIARLNDGQIIWTNQKFVEITGFSDVMVEQTLGDVLPGFSTEWVIDRKTESPYDVTVGGRRYRVYGTTVKSNDSYGIPLGIFYFSDLTTLYQVRDEYIRSRPVVSIILIDN